MNRVAIAALVVAFATLAHADTPASPAPKPEKPVKPDDIADVESREANLESKEPRKGLTFAGSISGGIMLGGDIGVGRGPSLSLRLGHVANRRTIITFELGFSTALHKQSISGPTLYDNTFVLFAGAQRYRTSSLWWRGAGGLTTLVKNAMMDGTGGDQPIGGIGALVGGGFDIARWGYLVLGMEAAGMTSLSSDGLKAQFTFGVGLSYY